MATGPEWHASALLAGINGNGLSEAEIYQRNGRVWVPPAARALDPELAEVSFALARSTVTSICTPTCRPMGG